MATRRWVPALSIGLQTARLQHDEQYERGNDEAKCTPSSVFLYPKKDARQRKDGEGQEHLAHLQWKWHVFEISRPQLFDPV